MHAALRVGKALLMLSDGSPSEGTPAKGDTVNVALDLDDPNETRRIFDALAAGGKVSQPIMDAP